MDNVHELESLLKPVLEDAHFDLEELLWLAKEKTLQISVVNQEGPTDLDACARVSEVISNYLDEIEWTNQEYNLEVCSPGAEREIKDLSKLKEVTYVHIDFKEALKNHLSLEGYLEKEGQDYVLTYRDKAVSKKLVVAQENIAFIRYAVKL